MAFSGALTLTDLNDFITPSQACIKPVEQTNKPNGKEPGAASTEISVDSAGSYYEVSANDSQPVKEKKKLEAAQISLNDCLACSGCITSAESVLITLQSHSEVLNFLSQNAVKCAYDRKIPVISIAPQTLASLAASISSSSTAAPVTLNRVLSRVEVFCKTVLGFEHVYDTTFARHISLLEHAREFKERKEQKLAGKEGVSPMLSSACPGWICYAEKTHAEMLPFISRTKSSQQIMGTLIKDCLAKKWDANPDDVYHVSVMPCYDKKLEASRGDFYNDIYSTRDVDCVITTGELELMMREKGWDLSKPVEGETIFPTLPEESDLSTLPRLIEHPGTSSGSYLQSLISTISASSPTPLELDVKTIRTADYEEFTLRDSATGVVVFKGAKCYGFRNLQNVVRKVGRDSGIQVGRGAAGRLAATRGRAVRARKDANGDLTPDKGYDYVEVMACPSGCVNGGGQLRPPTTTRVDAEGYKRDWEANGVSLDADDSFAAGHIQGQNAKWGDKEWTKKVEEAYWRTGLPTPPPSPPPDSHVHDTLFRTQPGRDDADRSASLVLQELCHPKLSQTETESFSWSTTMNDEAESRRRKLFRTEYRAVESEVIGLAVKW